jgi:hypothetical protein
MSNSIKQDANIKRHARRGKQRQNKTGVSNVSSKKIELTEIMLGQYFTVSMFDIKTIYSLIFCCRNFRRKFIPLLLSLRFISIFHAKRYRYQNEQGYVKKLFDVIDTNDLVSFHNIKKIIFNDNFDQYLDPGVLPSSLISLQFGDEFDRPLIVGALPSNLRKLKFGDSFNQLLTVDVLPSSLTSLQVGCYFNQPITIGVLPSSLTSLHFKYDFNQRLTIGTLPSSLTNLQFGHCFNQPLTIGVLPSKLTKLTFDNNHFHQLLSSDILPYELLIINFGDSVNQQLIANISSTKIITLNIGANYYVNNIISNGTRLSSIRNGLLGHTVIKDIIIHE